jgi:hypothetical protein
LFACCDFFYIFPPNFAKIHGPSKKSQSYTLSTVGGRRHDLPQCPTALRTRAVLEHLQPQWATAVGV